MGDEVASSSRMQAPSHVPVPDDETPSENDEKIQNMLKEFRRSMEAQVESIRLETAVLRSSFEQERRDQCYEIMRLTEKVECMRQRRLNEDSMDQWTRGDLCEEMESMRSALSDLTRHVGEAHRRNPTTNREPGFSCEDVCDTIDPQTGATCRSSCMVRVWKLGVESMTDRMNAAG